MSKKWEKALFGLTAIAAVGAGAYYLLKKKDEAEFEELENEFEDDDAELDADLEEVPAHREYVSLNPATEEVPAEETSEVTETPAEEIVEEKVVEEAPASDTTEEAAE